MQKTQQPPRTYSFNELLQLNTSGAHRNAHPNTKIANLQNNIQSLSGDHDIPPHELPDNLRDFSVGFERVDSSDLKPLVLGQGVQHTESRKIFLHEFFGGRLEAPNATCLAAECSGIYDCNAPKLKQIWIDDPKMISKIVQNLDNPLHLEFFVVKGKYHTVDIAPDIKADFAAIEQTKKIGVQIIRNALHMAQPVTNSTRTTVDNVRHSLGTTNMSLFCNHEMMQKFARLSRSGYLATMANANTRNYVKNPDPTQNVTRAIEALYIKKPTKQPVARGKKKINPDGAIIRMF